jgi:hypothetical protein
MTDTGFAPEVATRLAIYHEDRLEKLDEEVQLLKLLIGGCESPLEQLLLIELSEVFHASPSGGSEDLHLRGCIAFPEIDRYSVAIRQQHAMSIKAKDYRADFLITVEDWNWERGQFQLSKLVVEVDGHDFHERTKEQAQRDKSRDRAMVAQDSVDSGLIRCLRK